GTLMSWSRCLRSWATRNVMEHGAADSGTAIFLGDFIDRGPQQVKRVNIARRMVESGGALTVIGNLEPNAIVKNPMPSYSYSSTRNLRQKNLKQWGRWAFAESPDRVDFAAGGKASLTR